MKRRPVYIHHGAHSRVGEPHSDGAHAEEEAGAEDGPSETTRAVATCLQPVRDLAFALVESAWFKGFWVLAIIAYCIIQCLYAPLQPSDSARNRLVEVSNLAFTIAFTVELLLKVLAYGFLLKEGESVAGILGACCRPALRGLRKTLAARPGQEAQQHPESPHSAPAQQTMGDEKSSAGEGAAPRGSGAADAATVLEIAAGTPSHKGSPHAAAAGLDAWDGGDADDNAAPPAAQRTPLLRDPWNVLDFVVVVLSWISFIPGVGSGATAFRALRLLLPLKLLTALPGLKIGISSLLASVPELMNIIVAALFAMAVWTILGLQLYQNVMHNNCFVMGPNGQPLPYPPTPDSNSTDYTPEDNKGQMCSAMDVWAGAQCGDGTECRSSGGSTPMFGQLNFDNIFSGLLVNFMIITTAWWGPTTGFIMEATTGFSYFYAIVLVLLGFGFLLNMILAVIADKYVEAYTEEKEERERMANVECTTWYGLLPGRAKAWWYGFYFRPLPGALGRSETWWWRRLCKCIDEHWLFETVVIMLVLTNTVVLSMQFYGMSTTYEDRLGLVNNIVSFCFLPEAIIKILALGRMYFASAFNCFDFLVTIASVVAIFIPGASSISALRAVRVLRLLRLLTVIRPLQRFLRVMGKTLWMSMSLLIIVFFVHLIFGLLGMQLFGGKWDPYTDTPTSDAPWFNFNSFGAALLATFNIITGSLDDTMYYAMWTTSGAAAIYYILATIIGGFVILNLFVAVLYTLFNDEGEDEVIPHKELAEEDDADTPPDTKKVPALVATLRAIRGLRRKPASSLSASKSFKRVHAPETQGLLQKMRHFFSNHASWKGAVEVPLEEMEGTSFWIWLPTSRFRCFVFDIVNDKRFDAFVLAVTLFNCFVLAVGTPGDGDTMKRVLWWMDLACLIVYTVEGALKLIALSAWTGSAAYFWSVWNWLDAVIIVTSWIGTVLSAAWASTFRLLRVLRPLRLIARIKKIKAVVTCLVATIPSIGNACLVTLVILLVFAILGMELFLGKLHHCTSSTCCVLETCTEVTLQAQCTGAAADGSGECFWVPAALNFDNLWQAITALFVLLTGSAFGDVAAPGMDSVGVGRQPFITYSGWSAVFFVAYMLIAFLFIGNLFVGIILDNYAQRVRAFGPGAMLTDKQKAWVDAQRHLLRDAPKKVVAPPTHPVRRLIFNVVFHPLGEAFIITCILLNIIAMMMQHYQQSAAWDDALATANNVFTVIFCLESLLKIAALFPAAYFRDGWNCFDFVVSWASFPSIFVTTGPGVSLLRCIRIVRLLRMVQHVKSLKRLMTTLYVSLPLIGNALLLFTLVLFMYSVAGVQLFYHIQPSPGNAYFFNTFYNWKNAGQAMMMLSVVATGDSWEGSMLDTMVQPPFCDPGQCGTTLASIFFIFFMLVVSLILLSVLLAITIEAFVMSRDVAEVPSTNLQEYSRLWSRYDPDATMFIQKSEFAELLRQLDAPLGLKGQGKTIEGALEFIASLPGLSTGQDSGLVYYHEALQALTAHVMGVAISEIDEGVKEELEEEVQSIKQERLRRVQEKLAKGGQ